MYEVYRYDDINHHGVKARYTYVGQKRYIPSLGDEFCINGEYIGKVEQKIWGGSGCDVYIEDKNLVYSFVPE